MIYDSAFPSPMQHSLNGDIAYDKEFGLTKLEYFACEAMIALIQANAIEGDRQGKPSRSVLCDYAVKYAHSLIDALKEDEYARRKASDEEAKGTNGTVESDGVPGVQSLDKPVPDDGIPF